MVGVTMVVYHLVVEEVAPDADLSLAQRMLARLAPGVDEGWTASLPWRVPRAFDLKSVTEWMEALARAGLRCRIEIAAPQARGDRSFEPVEAERTSSSPWQRWWRLVREPERVFAEVRGEPPAAGILFGWVVLALGNVLALPGTVWLLRHVELPLAVAPVGFLVGDVLLGPIFTLLLIGLVASVVLRLVGVRVAFAEVLSTVGYAWALAPLRAVPVVGGLLAWCGFLWLFGIGVAYRFGLSVRQLMTVIVLPLLAVALFLGLVLLLGLVAAARLGELPLLDLSA